MDKKPQKMDKTTIFILVGILFCLSVLIGITVGYVSYNKLKMIEHNACVELYDVCTEKYNECNLKDSGIVPGVVMGYEIKETYNTS